MKTDEQVKQEYRRTNWGKFLLSIGMEPYDTESQARFVAKEAAKRIQQLKEELNNLQFRNPEDQGYIRDPRGTEGGFI